MTEDDVERASAGLMRAVKSFKAADIEFSRANDTAKQPRLAKAGTRYFMAKSRMFSALHRALNPAAPLPPALDMEKVEKALREITRLKPMPIGDTGFQTGPQELLCTAKGIARSVLSDIRKARG